MSYRGLILDFGGVLTTDFYGALSAFCVRQGLAPDAIFSALRNTDEGRVALAAVECGQIPQRAYETLANLIGADDSGLLGRALADLRPCQEVLDLASRARAAGIKVAVLSNSWAAEITTRTRDTTLIRGSTPWSSPTGWACASPIPRSTS